MRDQQQHLQRRCQTRTVDEPRRSNQNLRLPAGSPTTNIGSNSTRQLTDQRGASRLQGTGVDIGAYETPEGCAVACSLDMDGDGLLSRTKEGVLL